MTDDHDRCEWVNVSSGILSPGCPGQNPERRKTVVCVLSRTTRVSWYHKGKLGR